jgi:hypothetical protein
MWLAGIFGWNKGLTREMMAGLTWVGFGIRKQQFDYGK